MLSEYLSQLMQGGLDTMNAPLFTVTRPLDGSVRRVQLSVQTYDADTTNQFTLEADDNLSAGEPYRLMGLGGIDLKRGDELPINGKVYRILSVVGPPVGNGTAYTHALAIKR